MNEERINSLYITKMNDDKPIMIAPKSEKGLAVDLHTQFINVKSNKIELDILINNQNGVKIDEFSKIIGTTKLKSTVNKSFIGEIVTYLILENSEIENVNMLEFNVTINKKITGTTVLFLKENSHG
ncbi:hypothetical protein ACF0HZ_01675 [Leuconostoc suionicum]|uniref:hypothetical protein n=1 Tax=Leuconostoc suionicum TaxID=1511761 RepID=UPI003748E0FB